MIMYYRIMYYFIPKSSKILYNKLFSICYSKHIFPIVIGLRGWSLGQWGHRETLISHKWPNHLSELNYIPLSCEGGFEVLSSFTTIRHFFLIFNYHAFINLKQMHSCRTFISRVTNFLGTKSLLGLEISFSISRLFIIVNCHRRKLFDRVSIHHLICVLFLYKLIT